MLFQSSLFSSSIEVRDPLPLLKLFYVLLLYPFISIFAINCSRFVFQILLMNEGLF
jgi:hypothetical protein